LVFEGHCRLGKFVLDWLKGSKPLKCFENWGYVAAFGSVDDCKSIPGYL